MEVERKSREQATFFRIYLHPALYLAPIRKEFVLSLHHYYYSSQAMKAREEWIERIFAISCSKLDSNEKLTTWAISAELVSLGAPHTELTLVYLPNISSRIGFEKDAFYRSLNTLVRIKAVVRKIEKDGKKKKTRTHLAFSPLYIHDPVLALTDTPKRKSGGDRTAIVRHKGCGGEVVHLCKKCGEVGIPDWNTYTEYVDEMSISPDELQLTELQQLDQRANEIVAMRYNVDEVPDHIYERHGDAIFNMSPSQLTDAVKETREQYEGLCPEDEKAIERNLKEMDQRYKNDPKSWF